MESNKFSFRIFVSYNLLNSNRHSLVQCIFPHVFKRIKLLNNKHVPLCIRPVGTAVYQNEILTKKLNKHCHVLIESVVIIALYTLPHQRMYERAILIWTNITIRTYYQIPSSCAFLYGMRCTPTKNENLFLVRWPTHGAQRAFRQVLLRKWKLRDVDIKRNLIIWLMIWVGRRAFS